MVTTESGEETAFLDALTKMGIEPKTKDLQIFYGGAKKADWDVGMAVDAIVASSKLDAIILFTGDGDFIPLVHYLKDHACQVEVVSFGRSTSGKLKEATDHFLDLDEDPRRYLINYRPVRAPRGGRPTREMADLPPETTEKLTAIERATDVE